MLREAGRLSTRIHLAALVVIASTSLFVTVLIVQTGQLMTFWPLYLVPITVAALTYHVPGAAIVSASSAAQILLVYHNAGLGSGPLTELSIGMAAFTLSGLIIGAQARRHQQHGHQLEQASIVDPATGKHKSEYLLERFAEELRRSERYDLPCSIVIAQVDEFERFHEQFGRYKAGLLIEHLGEVLEVNLRDIDLLGRMGPESFAIVLPQTSGRDAEAVAARIRSVVADTEFEGDALEPVTSCTVSIAHSAYPEDGSTPTDLVRVARERLVG